MCCLDPNYSGGFYFIIQSSKETAYFYVPIEMVLGCSLSLQAVIVILHLAFLETIMGGGDLALTIGDWVTTNERYYLDCILCLFFFHFFFWTKMAVKDLYLRPGDNTN